MYPTPSPSHTLNATKINWAWPRPAKVWKKSCGYSQVHRTVPATVKKRVFAESGFDPKNHPPGEIDHLYPLCAGRINDLTNLRFQPATNFWNGKDYGHHEKDDLEAWVCQQIRARRLDPREAFDKVKPGQNRPVEWAACLEI